MVALPDIALAEGEADFHGILALQRANLRDRLEPGTAAREGFVSAVHTLSVLERMHALAPSVVAKHDGAVVGYALTMLREAGALVPALVPMMESLTVLTKPGGPLAEQRVYVMGQICIASGYRGQGVFDALYRGHDRYYGAQYDTLVTEISSENPRSLRAHQRIGFRTLVRHGDPDHEWLIVARDFTA